MKRDDVIRTLLMHKGELMARFPIASLIVFGSVARDYARTDSDVDVSVEFLEPVGYSSSSSYNNSMKLCSTVKLI